MIQSSMNPHDSTNTDDAVIRVPFWLVAVVSVSLLLISVGIYWLVSGGFAP